MPRFRRSRTGTPAPTVLGPTLADLSLSSVAWDLNATSGAVLATLVGKAAGSTVTITPNDGRIVMSSDSTQILRGLSAWTAGAISVQPTEANATSPITPHVTPAITVTVAAGVGAVPSAGWTGAYPGDGFGGSYGAQPTPTVLPRALTDPAKPTLAPFGGDREAFVSGFTLSVFSAAVGGLSKVRFHVAGSTTDVTQMTARTLSTAESGDGVARPIWGYHCPLAVASIPGNGWIKWYAEAFPADGSKATRIIGPFYCKKKATTVWDFDATVGAGQTYSTLNAALQAAFTAVGDGTVGVDHVRIRFAGNLTYDFATLVPPSPPAFSTLANRGLFEISRLTSSDTLLFVNSVLPRNGQVGFDVSWLRLGPGVKIDYAGIGTFYGAYPDNTTPGIGWSGRSPWYHGCELYSSFGLVDLGGSSGFPAEGEVRDAQPPSIGSRAILTECYIHDMVGGPLSPFVIRNLRLDNHGGDVLNAISYGHDPALQGSLVYGVRETNFNLAPYNLEEPGMKFNFTGSGALTYQTTGLVDQDRHHIFKRNGTVVYDFVADTTGTADASGFHATNYSMAQVAATWNAKAASDPVGTGINGLTSTPLSTTHRAATLGTVNNVAETPITSADLIIACNYDIHGDFNQWGTGGIPENVAYVNIKGDHMDGQLWFLTAKGRDCCFINCGLSIPAQTVGVSRWTDTNSHVFFWHISHINQHFLLSMGDFTADVNCEIYGSTFTRLDYEGSGPVANLLIQSNHVINVAAPTAPRSSNNNTGSSIAALFVDALNGDYTPQGGLLTSKVAPRVPFDIDGVARGGTSVRGPKVAAAGG